MRNATAIAIIAILAAIAFYKANEQTIDEWWNERQQAEAPDDPEPHPYHPPAPPANPSTDDWRRLAAEAIDTAGEWESRLDPQIKQASYGRLTEIALADLDIFNRFLAERNSTQNKKRQQDLELVLNNQATKLNNLFKLRRDAWTREFGEDQGEPDIKFDLNGTGVDHADADDQPDPPDEPTPTPQAPTPIQKTNLNYSAK